MLNRMKQQLISNNFVDNIRTKMLFDSIEYAELVSCLTNLSIVMKGQETIDKELMLYLYTIPQMIRDAFVSFDEQNNELAIKLEEAWIELDALAIDCLS